MKKLITLLVIALLAASLCLCFTGCKQKADFTVGIVQLVTHDALDAATQGFKDTLEAELKKAGKTVEFDYQNAAGDENTCPTIANSFVAKKVDLIMANATAALQAAANATLDIPVLGTSITEYSVALKLTNFNGVIGSNVSGTSDLAPLEEQAKMLMRLLPNARKIGLLYCSKEPNSDYQVKVVKSEIEKNAGYSCKNYTFTDSNDINAVVNSIVSDGCDAVYIPTDNTAASNGETIDNVLRPAGIPVFAGEEGICKTCGFATLSISYYNIGAKTGKMAADILLGKADIKEMAIQYDETPVKKYFAARCNGITIPDDYEEIK